MNAEEKRALRGRLLECYPEPRQARRVLQDAGVPVANVDLSGGPRDMWAAALSEAHKHDKLDAVQSVLRAEFPLQRDAPEAAPGPATRAGVRKTLPIAVILVLIACAAVILLFKRDDQPVWARGFALVAGVPQPVDAIEPAVAGKRVASFYFERAGGRVVAVERRNARQHRLEFRRLQHVTVDLCAREQESIGFTVDGVVRVEVEYAKDGALAALRGIGRDGRVAQRLEYAGLGKVWIRDSSGNPASIDGSAISGIERTLDESGHVRSARYLNAFGAPRPLWPGIFATHQRRDDAGRLTHLTFLTADGNPSYRREGEASITYTRDAHGEIVETQAFGPSPDSAPTLGSDLVHRWQVERDAAGNCVRRVAHDTQGPAPDRDGVTTYVYDRRAGRSATRFLDGEGAPIHHKDGFAAFEVVHDDAGRPHETVYISTSGAPTVNKSGAARVVERYDPKTGQVARRDFFAADGAPTRTAAGYASVAYTYDDAGRRAGERYFDAEGQATWGAIDLDTQAHIASHEDYGSWFATHAWVGGVVRAYDAAGRLKRESYLEPGGNPMIVNGYTARNLRYDERGLLVRVEFQGADAEPASDLISGCSAVEKARDRLGRIERETCLGQDGQATWLARLPIAALEHRFDALGNLVGVTYLDTQGQPTPHEGCHRERIDYDSRGYRSAFYCLDAAGAPAFHKMGHVRSTSTHNDRGLLETWSTFGLDGKPAPVKHGTVTVKEEYDEKGRRVLKTYLDANGRPTWCTHMHAGQAFRYDARGNETSVIHLDRDLKPFSSTYGHAIGAAKFDKYGMETDIRWFGADGSTPGLDTGPRNPTGVHRLEHTRNSRGQIIETKYFGPDGGPMPAWGTAPVVQRSWSPTGKLVEHRLFGADGKTPSVNTSGIHETRVSYDERDQRLEWTTWGLDDALVDDKDGIARQVFRYHDNGRRARLTSFAHTGQKIWERQDDRRGQHTLTRYFGPDGALGRASDGVAEVRYTWGAHGRLRSTAYYDAQGALTVPKDAKYARVEYDRDVRGTREVRYYDVQGALAPVGPSREAICEQEFDDYGNHLKTVFRAANGEVTTGDWGAAIVHSRYDSAHRLRERWYVDSDGQEVRATSGSARGASRRRMTYNDRGDLLTQAYFCPAEGDAKPVPCRLTVGHHLERRSYDGRGLRFETRYEDESGAAVTGPGGVARIVIRYAASGAVLEKVQYNADGQVLKGNPTAFVRKATFDAWRLLGRGGRVATVAAMPRSSGKSELLRIGDVVLRVNGKPVVCQSADKARRGCKIAGRAKAAKVELEVERWERGEVRAMTIRRAGGLTGVELSAAEAVAVW